MILFPKGLSLTNVNIPVNKTLDLQFSVDPVSVNNTYYPNDSYCILMHSPYRQQHADAKFDNKENKTQPGNYNHSEYHCGN